LLLRAAILIEKATKVLEELGRYYIPRTTRDAVAAEAQNLRRRAKKVDVPRSGGPRDPDHLVKVFAAEYAFDLLNYYQRSPTGTTEGVCFTLASILFEAATRRRGVSIVGQCRQCLREVRSSLKPPKSEENEQARN
jgi:hypothetical protein